MSFSHNKEPGHVRRALLRASHSDGATPAGAHPPAHIVLHLNHESSCSLLLLDAEPTMTPGSPSLRSGYCTKLSPLRGLSGACLRWWPL